MFDVRAHGGLPHPEVDARFYEGVPARRLVAFGVDLVAVTLLGLLAALVFGVMTLGLGFGAAPVVIAATGFLYRAGSLARWSATPGMALTGIEIRRFDGAPMTTMDAVAHTALFSLAVMFVVPQVASCALMIWGPLGRGLHDLPLGSAAIKSPA